MTLMKTILFSLFVASFSTIAVAETSPTSVQGATTANAEQAKKMFDDGALFVDVRKQTDWDAGRIPDALHLDIKSAFNKDALLEEASLDDNIVFYCNGHSCLRSSAASVLAVSWGFKNVYYFRDGIPAWKKAGYAVE